MAPVVDFKEDLDLRGGVPLIADLEACIVCDMREMLRSRRGRRPILMPPAT